MFRPYVKESMNIPPREQMRGMNKYASYTLAGIFIILAIGAVTGIYQLSKFGILYAFGRDEGSKPEEMLKNIPIWLLAVISVVIILGVLRMVSTYITKIVTFVFKIAQSDIITIILAVIINLAWLVLNIWITTNLIEIFTKTNVGSFYVTSNPMGYITMFLMLAATFIWIPRTGLYGENKLGQFDDGN